MSFGLRTVLVFLPCILLGVDFNTYPTLIRLSNRRHAWIKQSLGSLGFPQAKSIKSCLMKIYNGKLPMNSNYILYLYI